MVDGRLARRVAIRHKRSAFMATPSMPRMRGVPAAAHADVRSPSQRAGTAPHPMSGPPAPRSPLRFGLEAALWPWIVSRALVGGALAVAHEFVSEAHPSPAVAARVREGLLGWDAGWYESIARHGYGGAGHASLRFFPLVPILARALSILPGVGVGTSLVIVANVSAFVGTALLAAFARRETGDDALGRRVAWLVCLAPPAFTMVMGYAEATLLSLSVGVFWAMRTRKWWLASLLGFAAGTCRPIGVLLVLPAAVEGLREWRACRVGERAWRIAAVLGPAAGLGAFLSWVGLRYGDALAPLRIQEEGVHRGPISDPFSTLAHDASLLAHGHHLGSALHLPWVLLALFLVVVAFRKWPLSFAVFGGAVVLVGLTTANLDGFERYALSAFPLVLAGASVTGGERVERCVLIVAGAGLVAYALLAFTNLYVP